MNSPVGEAIKEAMRQYLKTCRSGGMPQSKSDLIDTHVDEAADLNYFDIFIADSEWWKQHKAQLARKDDEIRRLREAGQSVVYAFSETPDEILARVLGPGFLDAINEIRKALAADNAQHVRKESSDDTG